MTANGIFQILLYLAILLLLTNPLGVYMAKVYQGSLSISVGIFGRLEQLIYKVCGIDPEEEMGWQAYAISILVFSFIGLIVLFLLQRLQGFLPLNPQGMAGVSPDSSFNTAMSFISNTNWQAYCGEKTMSYFTQMLGLGVQNFLSAACGMSVLAALIRGFMRRSIQTIGSFWVDLTRTVLYILLPLSLVLAVILVSQGVVQSFRPYEKISLLQHTSFQQQESGTNSEVIVPGAGNEKTEAIGDRDQLLPLGPAASQVAIKQLGTNGGGFFNTNSAHPFENPTPLSNFLELLAILLIPAALCHTFGRMVGDSRQGWALLMVMLLIFIPLMFSCYHFEAQGNPHFGGMGIEQAGNMEGKEVRFGIATSALWATATTAASNGSVNTMHDSLSPLGGMIPLLLIQLGEIIFGGVGSGLYGMLVFAMIAVFVSGLMVGRTPEYLGKKIEAFEMKMASLVILIPAALVLVGTAIAAVTGPGVTSLANPGPHGFSEILYAFSSAGNNNGSAFAGLSADTHFFNTLLGLSMFFGRFGVMIPVLAIAGSLAAKKSVPVTEGTLPTHTPLFVILVSAIIILVGALTFIPALALGPIAEYLQSL